MTTEELRAEAKALILSLTEEELALVLALLQKEKGESENA